jgi:hypothetical protein
MKSHLAAFGVGVASTFFAADILTRVFHWHATRKSPRNGSRVDYPPR